MPRWLLDARRTLLLAVVPLSLAGCAGIEHPIRGAIAGDQPTLAARPDHVDGVECGRPVLRPLTVRMWRYDAPNPTLVSAWNHQMTSRVPRCRR